MTDSQKRTPRGVPTGGEFAANAHDEASSALQRASIPTLYPSEAEEWLSHIANRRGNGWEAVFDMGEEERDEIVAELRDLAAEDEVGEDNDTISESFQRESRTRVREASIEEDRHDRGIYQFVIHTSERNSTSVSLNRYEMEEWGNRLLLASRHARSGAPEERQR